MPTQKIAQNYLSELEIKKLERSVSAYFDYVERLLEDEHLLGMQDFAKSIDDLVIPPKRAASKSRINTSPAFSAGRVSLLKPSYAFALE